MEKMVLPLIIHTDHKPLMAIFNNTQAQLSAHIKCWVLRTQPYEMTVHYQSGHDNPSDYLSRYPANSPPSNREEKVAEEYLNYIISTSTPKAMTIGKVATETIKDSTFTAVVKAIITNK